MKFGRSLNLELSRTFIVGKGWSFSGSASGFATEWRLEIAGRQPLIVHDTQWDAGERHVQLQQPQVLPEMPDPLVDLRGRHRAGIEGVAPGVDRIMAYISLPQPSGRSRAKRALTTAQLV
jgi:hypothetical protein